MNKKTFEIFSNNEEERENTSNKWNHYVFDNTLYVCQNIEFVNDEYIEEIDAIFDNPSHELSIFLQSIVDQNKDFEICIGIVHGKQIMQEGVRYPHAHILLKRKN